MTNNKISRQPQNHSQRRIVFGVISAALSGFTMMGCATQPLTAEGEARLKKAEKATARYEGKVLQNWSAADTE